MSTTTRSGGGGVSGEETIASEVISACVGGAVSASLLYPLEVLKTKMQAQQKEHDEREEEDGDGDDQEGKKKAEDDVGMVQFAKNLYEKEGSEVFLRGIETSAFQSALEKACYFFAYSALKSGYHNLTGTSGQIGTAPNLVLGALAEWAHLPITLPVDAWTTAIQTSSSDGGGGGGGDTGKPAFQILLSLLSDKNRNFYRGIQAYWLLCWKPALQYTVYEQVKAIWLNRSNRYDVRYANGYARRKKTTLTAAEAFILGMVARTVATVLVFPFLRAKVLMQTSAAAAATEAKPSDEEKEEGDGSGEEGGAGGEKEKKKEKKKKADQPKILDLLLKLWTNEGLSGLYRGIAPELTRGIFSAALMLMIKERIVVVVRNTLKLLNKPI